MQARLMLILVAYYCVMLYADFHPVEPNGDRELAFMRASNVRGLATHYVMYRSPMTNPARLSGNVSTLSKYGISPLGLTRNYFKLTQNAWATKTTFPQPIVNFVHKPW